VRERAHTSALFVTPWPSSAIARDRTWFLS
jgi:hypothetical protein